MAEKFQIYNEQLQLLGKNGEPLNSSVFYTIQEWIVNKVSKILNFLPWARDTESNKIVGLQIKNNPDVLEVPREEVHSEQAEWLWHLASHLWVYSEDGYIVVQKRGENKDVGPSMYDASAAGHIDQVEDKSTAHTAAREAGEEISLKITPTDLHFMGIETYAMEILSKKKKKMIKNYEHKFVYLHGLPAGSLPRDGNKKYTGNLLKLTKGDQRDQEWLAEKKAEVAELKVFTLDELEEELKTNPKEYLPRVGYWLEVIAEIRAQIASRKEIASQSGK